MGDGLLLAFEDAESPMELSEYYMNKYFNIIKIIMTKITIYRLKLE